MSINRRGFLSLLPATALAAAPKASPIYSLAWHPDGQRLAIGGFREVRLVKVPEEPVTTFSGAIDAVRAVAFSPDGTRIAMASDVIDIRDVKTGKSVQRIALDGKKDPEILAFSADGSKITTIRDAILQSWDITTGKSLGETKPLLPPRSGEIRFAPNAGRVIAHGCNVPVRVVDVKSGNEFRLLETPKHHLTGNATSFTAAQMQAADAGSCLLYTSPSPRD